MTFSRLLPPSLRPATEAKPDVARAEPYEPSSGVLSLTQLMLSLEASEPHLARKLQGVAQKAAAASPAPDETLFFPIDELVGRKAPELPAAAPARSGEPLWPSAGPAETVPPIPARAETVLPSAARVQSASSADERAFVPVTSKPVRSLSAVTKLTLGLLPVALGLFVFGPRLARPTSESPRATRGVSSKPSTTASAAATAVTSTRVSRPDMSSSVEGSTALPSSAREPAPVLTGHGVSAERVAADRLAAGDFAGALSSYRALAAAHPRAGAYAAAVRVLERRLRVEKP